MTHLPASGGPRQRRSADGRWHRTKLLQLFVSLFNHFHCFFSILLFSLLQLFLCKYPLRRSSQLPFSLHTSLSLPVTPCHFLSLPVTPCHSLSLPVCHSSFLCTFFEKLGGGSHFFFSLFLTITTRITCIDPVISPFLSILSRFSP